MKSCFALNNVHANFCFAVDLAHLGDDLVQFRLLVRGQRGRNDVLEFPLHVSGKIGRVKRPGLVQQVLVLVARLLGKFNLKKVKPGNGAVSIFRTHCR